MSTPGRISVLLPFLARLCRRSVIRYLEKERKERKSMRSILDEHEVRG
jgi:hypothetical protein